MNLKVFEQGPKDLEVFGLICSHCRILLFQYLRVTILSLIFHMIKPNNLMMYNPNDILGWVEVQSNWLNRLPFKEVTSL